VFQLFQIAPVGNYSGFDNLPQAPDLPGGTPWWVVALFILGGLVVLFICRWLWHRLTALKISLDTVVLLVQLPRETGKIDETKEKITPQSIQEQIGVADVFLSALGGIKSHNVFIVLMRKIRHWFKGREDQISLELVAQNGVISFYVAVPKRKQAFVEQQINAHYPHATLEEVGDYNIFTPRGVSMGVNMKLGRSSAFPLKTYKQFETDPLNAITNSMSKIPDGDAAAVQLIIRSAHGNWRHEGIHMARQMQKGKRLSDISGNGIFSKILSVLGTIFSSLSSSSKDKHKEQSSGPIRLSPLVEEMIKGLEQKASKAGFEITCRVLATAKDHTGAELYLHNIVNAFSQFNIYEFGNRFEFKKPWIPSRFLYRFVHRVFDLHRNFILNSEELASLYHFPLPTTETPNIRWLAARRAPGPVNMPKEGLILGINTYRGIDNKVRIKPDDRRRHMYIIGKSGTGKSVMLQNMIIQDVREGKGVCVVDPHGDLVEGVLQQIPAERANDVIVFDPSDTERPMGLNMLEFTDESQKDFAVQEMIAIFYKLFPPEMIGPMFEHNMRNVMLTLMADKEYPGTIADIPRMFTDPAFQKYKVSKLADPVVRAFWEKEMAKTTDFHKSEMLGYLISKVGRFVENEMMRNIIGQPKSGFDFRQAMDEGKVLLVNLSKGKTGEVNSSLLGLIIVSKIQMAAMTRAELPEAQRKDFYLYIDEFQNFITDSIATILSEARKYRLNLIIAHQYLGQLVQNNDTKIRDAVLGTTGTIVSFKIGVEDAETIAKEFAPVFTSFDVVNIEQYNAYIKLLIDNAPTRPFNMRTLPPAKGDPAMSAKLKQLSRLKYARSKAEVEAEVLERTKLGEPSTQAKVSNEATL